MNPFSRGGFFRGGTGTPPPALPESASTAMNDMGQRLTALEARTVREARGVKAVPAIGNVLGGTVTVRVTLNAAMPSAAYTATAVLTGGAVLGSLKINSTTIIDAQTVDVVVQSSGLLTLAAATVLVFADA